MNILKKNIDKLSQDSIDKLENNTLRILDSNNPDDSEVIKKAPNISEYINDKSKSNFDSLLEILSNADIEYQIDNSLVRGLDYYNDLTFEFITSENVVVGGGGRYDNLAEILSLGKFNGVGVAFGVERIMNSIPLPDNSSKYYLLGTDINKISNYAKELDKHNINYSKPPRLTKENAQFKDAKNQNVMYLINTDEDTIKNLITNQIEKFNIEVILEHQ